MAQVNHKFAVGAAVRYSPGTLETAAVRGSYTIVRQLPPEAKDCQYRVKSAQDGHERIVRESQLTAGLI